MVRLLNNAPFSARFHHVGCATTSLEVEREFFGIFGYEDEGPVFTDELQGVRGCFLAGPGPRVEILENLPNSDTLTPWLTSGVKYYHFAFLVPDVVTAQAWARAKGAKGIVDPRPAVAFEGRLISFVMFRNRALIEFIQSS